MTKTKRIHLQYTPRYGICFKGIDTKNELTSDRKKVTCKTCLRLLNPVLRYDKLVALLRRQGLTPDSQAGFDGSLTVTCEQLPSFKAVFYHFNEGK
jgi:hypothetical protein